MKKRIIAIVILVFVVAAGALLAWQYMKTEAVLRFAATVPIR